ncbi:hypothetical protein [Azospirillum isscasi]|uniref:Uncharacterized protein n=1 Tax=Azospirillum isscasi TaxID=3053926 RepID=A0ABU0WPW2_9PROT|nr:hypothetical protein [Azospirillum isscasi]MDQ2105604.1 hypothetical protein [Azospirillum isscasi]
MLAALISSGLVAGLLMTGHVIAQETTKESLSNDVQVQQSQEPPPNQQGVRAPKASTSGDTQGSELQQALADLRRAPPDLQGNPVPRPNQWASEPDMGHEPTRSENPSDLSSQEAK